MATGADDLDEVADDCVAGADATGDVFGVICSGATATDGLLVAGAATAEAGFCSAISPLFFFSI